MVNSIKFIPRKMRTFALLTRHCHFISFLRKALFRCQGGRSKAIWTKCPDDRFINAVTMTNVMLNSHPGSSRCLLGNAL